jgi:Tol biopolymer transport system component
MLTNGSGTSERLTRSPNPQAPTSASPRADAILFDDVDPVTKADIWELSLSSKETRPILKTPFNEGAAVFSPDGHWIAYQSDESGGQEVYVQAYPGPGAKRRVSVEGGSGPSWSHTGRELFYQTPTAMFAVPILDVQDLRVGPPRLLFAKVRGEGIARADPSLDDQRFLMMERRPGESAPLNIVQNWFEELKAKVLAK